MKNSTERKKSGGRPTSYSQGQIYGIVARLIEFDTPLCDIDAARVREELCRNYKVSQTIRLDSLQRHVDDAIADIEQSKANALDLPPNLEPIGNIALAEAEANFYAALERSDMAA